jgi:FkbM family methyltransferase
VSVYMFRNFFKSLLLRGLRKFDLNLSNFNFFLEIKEKADKYDRYVNYVRFVDKHASGNALSLFGDACSQIGQDIFVLSFLKMKEAGYFVEFGATDGICLSNTYLLETKYGWRGILAEPARGWHSALQKNRKAVVDKRCVWSTSGELLNFQENEVGELSGLIQDDRFAAVDAKIKSTVEYRVETISLIDLLDAHDAPSVIDYLSIDTEGSEYEILKSFDFSKYKFKIITCEHNFAASRSKIYDLLIKNGYERCCEDVSQFDDWYLNKSCF